jgi:hypothetical protein
MTLLRVLLVSVLLNSCTHKVVYMETSPESSGNLTAGPVQGSFQGQLKYCARPLANFPWGKEFTEHLVEDSICGLPKDNNVNNQDPNSRP